jgi:hypothetical protein
MLLIYKEKTKTMANAKKEGKQKGNRANWLKWEKMRNKNHEILNKLKEELKKS